jgi:hypothetical protein
VVPWGVVGELRVVWSSARDSWRGSDLQMGPWLVREHPCLFGSGMYIPNCEIKFEYIKSLLENNWYILCKTLLH